MTTNYPNGIDNDTTLPPVVPQQEGPIVGPPGPAGPPGPRGVSGPPGLSNGPAGGDLSGHYPNPFIIKISGDGVNPIPVNSPLGDGVNPIPINSPLITWKASVVGPVGFTQTQALSGAGTPMAMGAQAAATGSNANGGNLILISGTGDGTGHAGSAILATGDGRGELSINPTNSQFAVNGAQVLQVNATNLSWNASVVGPVGISQDQSITAGGQSMEIVAQAAATGSNTNGGSLFLTSGLGDGTGVPGNAVLATGNLQNALSVTPTKSQFTVNGGQVLQINPTTIAWNASVAGPVGLTQDQSVTAGGQLMEIVAQAAATGSNTNGGGLLLASGAGDGTGVAGNAILSTGDLQCALSVTPTKSQFIVGGGQVLQVNATNLSWNASVAGPVGLTQDQSLIAGGAPMEIAAQSAATGSNANGGTLVLASGAGDGTGSNGTIFIVTPDFQNGLLVAGNGVLTLSATNNPMLQLGATAGLGGGLGLGNNTGGSFSLAAGGTITLTPAQYKYPFMVFNGTLPNNTTIVLPANPGSKWVIDATGVILGGNTLTLQANGVNWGTTIGTTDLYEVIYGGVGQLYGNVLTP